jgi:hypothetical protein
MAVAASMGWIEQTRVIRLRFRDNDGAESTCQTNLPTGISHADALAFLLSWRGLVSVLSSAVCIEADLFLRWVETMPDAASASADLRRHGVLIFSTPAPTFAAVRVHSLDESYLESVGPFAGIRIDQTLAAVQDLALALSTGVAGVQACDPFLNDLLSIAQAYKEQF